MTFVRRDIARYYYPMWKYATDSLAEGRVPLWNPLVNFGAPFLANLQNCVFYPPAILLRTAPYGWAFNAYIVLHLAAAGAWTYAWARDNRQTRAGALLAGLAYSLSGYLLSAVNLTISLCTAAYLPLVLLCVRRALREPTSRSIAAASCAVAMQFLAGDPAVWLGTMLAVAGSAAWRALCAEPIRPDRLAADARTLTLVLGLFAALAAYQIVPFAELILRSSRLRLGSEATYMWSLHYNDLAGLVVPYFHDLSMYVMDYWTRQSWLENAYLGSSVAVLAVWACRVAGSDRSVRAHAWLGTAGILLALGGGFPAYVWLHQHVPLLGLVRYPVRFLFLTHFAAAVLAGALVSRTQSGAAPGVSRAAVVISLALGAAAAASVLWHEPLSGLIQETALARYGSRVEAFYSQERFREFLAAAWGNTSRSLVFAAFASLGAAAALRAGVRAKVSALFFVTLTASDLATANLVEPVVSRESFEAPSEHVRYLLEDPDLFRVSASPKAIYQQTFSRRVSVEAEQRDQKNRLASNYLMPHGLYDAMGYDSLYLSDVEKVQEKLLKRRDPGENRMMDWLNIKYLASPLETLGPPLRAVNRTDVSVLYLNERWMPRAFVVPEVAVVPDGKRRLEILSSADYDPAERILIERQPDGAPASVPRGGLSKAGRVSDEANRLGVDVEGVSGGWLFVSDAYDPGWRARIDGADVRTYRANHAFRAVFVPPGAHRVTWSYEPPLAAASACVSAAALAWLILIVLIRRRSP